MLVICPLLKVSHCKAESHSLSHHEQSSLQDAQPQSVPDADVEGKSRQARRNDTSTSTHTNLV